MLVQHFPEWLYYGGGGEKLGVGFMGKANIIVGKTGH